MDQVFLKSRYFWREGDFEEKVILKRRYFWRAGNFEEKVLFKSKYIIEEQVFLKSREFWKAGIFEEQVFMKKSCDNEPFCLAKIWMLREMDFCCFLKLNALWFYSELISWSWDTWNRM